MNLSESNAVLIRDLSAEYNERLVLKGINLEIVRGYITGIIGPNGSGKTTLLKCIIKQLPFKTGHILLLDHDLAQLSVKEIARKVGVVPQKWQSDFTFSARDLVAMGRYPYIKRFAPFSAADHAIVDHAMKATSTFEYAERPISEMSGGELQRVIIAQALAQTPEILLLDEPTSSLDISHQIEVCELMKDLAHRQGITVVMVLHDLNLAAQFCDRLVLLKEGTVFAQGDTSSVLTSQNLHKVYSSKIRVVQNSLTAKPYIIFNPSDDSAKLNEPSCPFKVHLIGGGGSVAELMFQLHSKGYDLSAGVLNVLDSDWSTANQLGIPIAEEAPFSPITRESLQANLNLIREADLIILGNIPFGEGNLLNLEAVQKAQQMGKKVWICDFTSLEERDFTHGSAVRIYDELKCSGAVFYREISQIIADINQLSEKEEVEK